MAAIEFFQNAAYARFWPQAEARQRSRGNAVQLSGYVRFGAKVAKLVEHRCNAVADCRLEASYRRLC